MRRGMIVALVAMGFFVQGLSEARAKDSTEPVLCPVMGQPVKDLKTAARSEYKGQTYYFCCPSCKEKFDKDPEKYVGKARSADPQGSQEHQTTGETCSAGSGCGHRGH